MSKTYHGYLKSIFPGTSWAIQDINGGFVNTTLRVVKTDGVASASSFILKHARPSFGEPGFIQKFSLRRQDIEKTALRLWDDGEPLHGLTPVTDNHWRVPKCIRHDIGLESALHLTDSGTEAAVLLIEDLGDVCDVMTYIERGSMIKEDSANVREQIARCGEALGVSLARLHSNETLKALSQRPHIESIFSQSLTDHLVWSAMLDLLPAYLKPFPDAEQLYQRVEEDFKRPKYTYPQVLCHGDFHTGNIMMPASVDATEPPAVLDWEFAHLGRGLNDDAVKFTASLHCALIDARNNENTRQLATILRLLIEKFSSGYRETARLCYSADPDDTALQLMRSAMLFHGTEMIVYGSEFMEDSAALPDMLAVGVWYLRRACEDMATFARQDLDLLRKEEDGMVITSLFLN